MHFTAIFAIALLTIASLVSAAPTPTQPEAMRWLQRRNPHNGQAQAQAQTQGYGQGNERYTPFNAATSKPSASSVQRRRETAILPTTLPLGVRDDLARCPSTMMACPILPTSASSVASANVEWECVSPDEDLYSCGGCATLGWVRTSLFHGSPCGIETDDIEWNLADHAPRSTGTDCTAIQGVNAVSCNAGTCNVHSCSAGYAVSSNGTACVAVLVAQH